MKRVVVIGAATVDCMMKSSALKVMKSHTVPGGVAMCEVLGGKMEAEEGVLTTGGGGTNVSVGLRRLGHSVKVVSRVGDDDLSRMVEEKLRQENVNTELLQRGRGKTGLSAVLVASDGGRSIITYRGESGHVLGVDIDWEEVKKAEWIQVSSLGGQIELLEDIVMFANKFGIKIGLNPGKGELDQRERIVKLLPKLDFVNLNRMEASILWKENYEDERKLMKNFFDNGVKGIVAITDGKRGAGISSEGRWVKMEAFPNKSIDDTGAGDAFVSGAVSGILDGLDIEKVIKMGLANGGSTVLKLGAKEGLLYKKDMEKWLGKKVKSMELTI